MKAVVGASVWALLVLAGGVWAAPAEGRKGVAEETDAAAVDAVRLDQPPGVYAVIETARGRIVSLLEHERTPLTVANFVGLAEGTKEANREGPFFDGLTFHRVVKAPSPFVIQGGCPLGNGMGNPGYRFEDEFHDELRHDRAGMLSMANSGKDTNGSQFFITLAKTPWLDGRHTVFGHVVEGMDVVRAIEAGDVMESVRIVRLGEDAQAFEGDEAAFQKFQAALQAEREAAEEARRAAAERVADNAEAVVAERWPDAIQTASGLRYIVTEEGSGKPPAPGTQVKAHYTGRLLDGTTFDSSHNRGRPFEFAVGRGMVIRAWDEALQAMTKGEKRTLIVPPALGYGARGAGRVIPPNAWLVFDVELVDF